MTKISIVFVAALALAAFGCKKKGADCDSAITNMIEVSKAELSKAGMDDKMLDKMKGIAMQRCKDDKWPDDALKCMKEAKSGADAQKCQSMLPKDMDEKMKADIAKAMGMGGGGAGGAPPAGGGAPEGSAGGSAAAGGGGGGDMPKECTDYKAVIDKLATCDKMPPAQRDTFKQAYDQASAGWANLPPEAKANVATACKAGADAVTAAAKSACGW